MTIWQEFYSELGFFHIQQKTLPGNVPFKEPQGLFAYYQARLIESNTMFPMENIN